MKRLTLFFLSLILLTSLTSVASAAPKHASNVKRVGHQAAFPFRHPLATIEATISEVVTYVGAAVDLAERGTAALHAGVSKVDEAIDKIEDLVVHPPAAPPISPAVPESQTLAIPGCTAKAFVPKGCYTQTSADLAEVRCPGQTFKFRCLPTP